MTQTQYKRLILTLTHTLSPGGRGAGVRVISRLTRTFICVIRAIQGQPLIVCLIFLFACASALAEAEGLALPAGHSPAPPDDGWSKVEGKPTCAVLPFEAGQDVHKGKTTLMCNRFATLLAKTGKYEIFSTFRMNQILATKRFDHAAYRSMTEYSIAAGKILNVQYVICGRVERTGERYTLLASLVQVETGRIIRTVRSSYTGELDEFVKLAPAPHLKELLGLKEILPVTVAPERPKPEQAVPGKEPKPVVKPLKPEVILPRYEPSRLPIISPELQLEEEWPGPELWNRTREVLSDHLELGMRMVSFKLLNTKKNTFLGTIDYLDADGGNPFRIYAHWLFTPYYGIELTWDHVEATTMILYDGHSDGTIVMTGPVVVGFGCLPIDSMIGGKAVTFVPYAGIGFAILDASFSHEGWWHHGFPGEDPQEAEREYNEWVATGSPPWPNGGYERTMNLDNTIGLVVMAGCTTEVAENLSVEFYLRYMDAQVDDEFTLSRYGDVFDRTYATFPMGNFAFGLGVKYAF